MNIGRAVDALKAGDTVQREGWNGKGMFLFVVHADDAEHEFDTNGETVYAAVGAYVMMKTAQGYVIPWLCSQADLLADDWQYATI